MSNTTRPIATALLYHRVADPGEEAFPISVSPANFREQMEVVAALTPLDLDTVSDQLRQGTLTNGGITITFDDGYRDNLTAALPTLEHYGVPATVFITTATIGTNEAFWWDQLAHIIRQAPEGAGPATLHIGNKEAQAAIDGPLGRKGAVWQLWAVLRRHGRPEIDAALESLRGWSGPVSTFEYDDDTRPLNTSELATLASNQLVGIGAHTVTHPMLAARPTSEQRLEISAGRRQVEEWIGSPVSSFAYPYGRPRVDYTRRTARLVREAGFKTVCTVADREIARSTNPLALPRWAVPDLGGDEFAKLLSERLKAPSPKTRLRRVVLDAAWDVRQR